MGLLDIIAVSHNHTEAFNLIVILQLMLLLNLLQAVKELKFLVVKQLVIQAVNLFPMAIVMPAMVCQIFLVYLQHLQTEASQAFVVKGDVVSRSVVPIHRIVACKTNLMAHLCKQLLAIHVFHIEILIDTFSPQSSMSMVQSILAHDSSRKHAQRPYHKHVRDYARKFLQARHKSPHEVGRNVDLKDTMAHVIRNNGYGVCRGACRDVFHGVLHSDHRRYSGDLHDDDHDDNLG